jgi:hypothetical protein
MSDLESRSHDLFTQLLGMAPSEWPAFLELHCETPELRDMVQRLLDMHVRSGDFLALPASLTYPSLASVQGEKVAEFSIIRRIGKGGMGLVYLAEDTKLKRYVALKTVQLAPNEDSDVIGRFRREARAAARLSHPGIVRIYRDEKTKACALSRWNTLRAPRFMNKWWQTKKLKSIWQVPSGTLRLRSLHPRLLMLWTMRIARRSFTAM